MFDCRGQYRITPTQATTAGAPPSVDVKAEFTVVPVVVVAAAAAKLPLAAAAEVVAVADVAANDLVWMTGVEAVDDNAVFELEKERIPLELMTGEDGNGDDVNPTPWL